MYKSRYIKYISKMKKISKNMKGGANECTMGCGNDCEISCSIDPSHCICRTCFNEVNINKTMLRQLCREKDVTREYIVETRNIPCTLGCIDVNLKNRGIMQGFSEQEKTQILNDCDTVSRTKAREEEERRNQSKWCDIFDDVVNRSIVCPYGNERVDLQSGCLAIQQHGNHEGFCAICLKRTEDHTLAYDIGGDGPHRAVYYCTSICTPEERSFYKLQNRGYYFDIQNYTDPRIVDPLYAKLSQRIIIKKSLKLIRDSILNNKATKNEVLKCLEEKGHYSRAYDNLTSEEQQKKPFAQIMWNKLYHMIRTDDRNLFNAENPAAWNLNLYLYMVDQFKLLKNIDFDIIDNEAIKNEIKNRLLPQQQRRDLNLNRYVTDNTLTLTRNNTFDQELIQGDIPNVEFLIFGEDFLNNGAPLVQGILPNSIERLDLGNFINGGLPITREILPQNLKAISLSSSIENIDNLPENIKIVYLANYKGTLNQTSLPQNLKLLYLNNYTHNNQVLDSSLISPSVKYIINEGKTRLNKEELEAREIKIIE
jgi:hypothetical protein